MSKQKQPFEPNRRAFLRTVAFGGGMLVGTGIGFAAPVPQSDAGSPTAAAQEPERAAGYHETAHIREYYRKAGF